jgi:hypothetical protein
MDPAVSAAGTAPDDGGCGTRRRSCRPLPQTPGTDLTGPEPAARAVVALLSDWFPRTTGEIVHVDGGVHAMGPDPGRPAAAGPTAVPGAGRSRPARPSRSQVVPGSSDGSVATSRRRFLMAVAARS